MFIMMSNMPTAAPSEKYPNSKACLYMYKDKVVVEDKGPPLVIINCKSKNHSADSRFEPERFDPKPA